MLTASVPVSWWRHATWQRRPNVIGSCGNLDVTERVEPSGWLTSAEKSLMDKRQHHHHYSLPPPPTSSLGVWDRGLMTIPVSDRPRSWSWSYTFGLASNTVVHDKTLCDMIMLKCRPIISTCVLSYNTYINCAKRYWSSFFDFLCTKLFLILITHMRVATEVFFCYVFLLLLNWSWSWSWSWS